MPLSRRLRTLLLLALVCLAAHCGALSGLWPGALPSSGDTIGAFLPWHEFARRALWDRGEMPLWNPHLYCGIPFMGNGQSGSLYPPNYLSYLLPESSALWLFAFGHNLFLMVGAYFLGRTLGLKRRASFLVAVLLGLGNAVPAHQFGGHLTFLPTRSFWPWEAAFLLRVLRGQGRSNAILLAVCIALGLVAGAPQIWLFGLVFCAGIYAFWISRLVFCSHGLGFQIWKRAQIPLCLAALFVVLWCAPILLPLRELRDWSAHSDVLSFEQVTDLSATSRSLFRLLFNGYFGRNSYFMWSLPSNPGEDAASIGLAAFLLAIAAPLFASKSRVVLALMAFCAAMIVLALGSATPLYFWLYGHISLFQTLRVPARWLELWAFGASLLAGYAFDGLLRQPHRVVLLKKLCGTACAGCFVLLGITFFLRAPWETGARMITDAMPSQISFASQIARDLRHEALFATLSVGFCMAFLTWILRHGLNRSAVTTLVLCGLMVEPLGNFWLSISVASPELVSKVYLPPGILNHARVGQRWIVRARFGQLNAPLVAGVDALNGYEPFGSAPFFEFANAAQHGTLFSADFQPLQTNPLWRVAGASALLWKPKYDETWPVGFPGNEIVQANRWHLGELGDGLRPWPRAYLTRRIIRATAQNRYRLLSVLAAQPLTTPGRVVVEPDFPALNDKTPTNDKAQTPVKVISRTITPDVLEWDVSTAQNAVFVDQDALAPLWKAYVDGQPQPLHRVNGFFRGVYVPAHARRVAIVCDSQTLRFAFFLGLNGMGLAAAMWITASRNKKSRNHPLFYSSYPRLSASSAVKKSP